MLRRSCRTQLVADTAVITFLLAIQIVLIYLLWMKDRFFIPPELLVAGFIETVLVTLVLQVVAVIQLILVMCGIYGFCTHRVMAKDDTGYRVDVKDFFFGVLYIPLCLSGAFLTATASRPWQTKPLEGGADIFVRILPLALVVFAIIPGAYVVYHGCQSSLLRSPNLNIAQSSVTSTSSVSGTLAGNGFMLVVMGLSLLPIYILLILYPPFALVESTTIHTVLDMDKLVATITFVLVTLTGAAIVMFLSVSGIQCMRRQRHRGPSRLQQEVNLDILHEP
ncbi:hypothetical protein DFH05DRAFT_1459000 [Lentinula detonsa]|uniref:Uncharacterized protein n=1 Tax=Lentinula detonsa TaxID=2804962 RepID=A0A9W8P4J4_9AGAR|nr:hypothetical protein DFH05DRAFT_1459000 [Lentinula detonsa]